MDLKKLNEELDSILEREESQEFKDFIQSRRDAETSQLQSRRKSDIDSPQKNEAETITIGSGGNGDYYDYNGTRYVGHYVTQYLLPKLKGKKLNFIKGINSFKSDRFNKVLISDDLFNIMKDTLLKSLAEFESAQKDLANHLLQVLSKGGATLRQLQDFESKGYSDKVLSDTLKDLIQQKKIKPSFEGGTTRYTLVESAQMNESRNYSIQVEVSAKDNMNNAAIEDEIIHLLISKNFDVLDVTATRK